MIIVEPGILMTLCSICTHLTWVLMFNWKPIHTAPFHGHVLFTKGLEFNLYCVFILVYNWKPNKDTGGTKEADTNSSWLLFLASNPCLHSKTSLITELWFLDHLIGVGHTLILCWWTQMDQNTKPIKIDEEQDSCICPFGKVFQFQKGSGTVFIIGKDAWQHYGPFHISVDKGAVKLSWVQPQKGHGGAG